LALALALSQQLGRVVTDLLVSLHNMAGVGCEGTVIVLAGTAAS
jgi:hypothetical protein